MSEVVCDVIDVMKWIEIVFGEIGSIIDVID